MSINIDYECSIVTRINPICLGTERWELNKENMVIFEGIHSSYNVSKLLNLC